MLSLVDEALRGPRGGALVAALRERWRYALIDEFQDTDETQWSIFRRAFFEPDPRRARASSASSATRSSRSTASAAPTWRRTSRARDDVAPPGGERVAARHELPRDAALVDATNALFDASRGGAVLHRRHRATQPVACGRPGPRPRRRRRARRRRPSTSSASSGELSLPALAARIARGDPRRSPTPTRPWRLGRRAARAAGRLRADAHAACEGRDGRRRAAGGRRPARVLQGGGPLPDRRGARDPHAAPRRRRPRRPRAPPRRVAHALLRAAARGRRARARAAGVAPVRGAARRRGRRSPTRATFERLFESIVCESGVLRREIFFADGERELTNYLHVFELLLEHARAHPGHAARSRARALGAHRQDAAAARPRGQRAAPRERAARRADHDDPQGQGPRGRRRLRRGRLVRRERQGGARLPRRAAPASPGWASPSARREAAHPGRGARGGPAADVRGADAREGPPVPAVRDQAGRAGEAARGRTTSSTGGSSSSSAQGEPAARGRGRAVGPGAAAGAWRTTSLGRVASRRRRSSTRRTRRRSTRACASATRARSSRRTRACGARGRGARRRGRTSPRRGAPQKAEEAVDAAPVTTLRSARASGVFVHEVLERVPLASFARRLRGAGARARTSSALFDEAIAVHRVDPAQREHAERLVWAAYTTPVALPGGGAPRAHRRRRAGRARDGVRLPRAGDARVFVRGSLDLAFEHGGRTYFVDWKTDALPSYAPGRGRARTSHAHYDEQVRLYALAVVKLLGVSHARGPRARASAASSTASCAGSTRAGRRPLVVAARLGRGRSRGTEALARAALRGEGARERARRPPARRGSASSREAARAARGSRRSIRSEREPAYLGWEIARCARGARRDGRGVRSRSSRRRASRRCAQAARACRSTRASRPRSRRSARRRRSPAARALLERARAGDAGGRGGPRPRRASGRRWWSTATGSTPSGCACSRSASARACASGSRAPPQHDAKALARALKAVGRRPAAAHRGAEARGA